jgi:flagellar biosynthetic protein FliP
VTPTTVATTPTAPLPGVVGQRPADTRTPAPPPSAQAATVAQAGSPRTGASEPAAAARVDTMLTRLAPRLDLRVGSESAGGLRLSGTVGIVVMMGLMTLLPTLILMMTGFTRILIVLHFLRQALGTQSAPPAHLVAGLALLLTGFVMTPTLRAVNETALQPWMDGRIEQAEMLRVGVQPFRAFMLEQTRDADIRAFLEMSETPEPAAVEEVPLVVLVSAFVTSELRTAFQIGFALFLPFIIIDVVVSSVLMSMGMFMLPPAMISLPFKLLLFVLVDGWTLLTQSLIASFR